jgi:O-antigen/teichoic acid export membrane protein
MNSVTERNSPPQPLNRLAIRGGVAIGAAQLVKIVLQFVSVVTLARLLQPNDFGLVAAAAPLASFVTLFSDFGMQQAIIQRQNISDALVEGVFWFTVMTGGACAAVVLLMSPVVAWFFADTRLLALTAATSGAVLIGSLCATPSAMLNRAMRFGTLAWIDVGAASMGLAIAIASAWLGAGYWSLVLASLGSIGITLIWSWSASGFAPGRPRHGLPEERLLSFGAHLTGFAVLNFFSRNLDNILIGRYAGTVALGYYDRGYKLLLFPLQNIMNPLSRVMLPLLSRIQADKPRLRTIYLRVLTQIILATVPSVAAATVTADDVINLLFGPQWAPVVPIFAWLGVVGLVQPLNNSSGWLFMCQARTPALLRWGLYSSATTVIAFVVGLPWGAVGVAAAYTISDFLVRTPVLYYVIGRMGPVTAGDLLRLQVPPLIAALGTYAIVRWLISDLAHLSGAPRIAAALVISYSLTLALIALRKEGRIALREGGSLARSMLLGRANLQDELRK